MLCVIEPCLSRNGGRLPVESSERVPDFALLVHAAFDLPVNSSAEIDFTPLILSPILLGQSE